MTEERRDIARRYVHDMINSFVEDPHTGNSHMEYDPPNVSFYSPDIELLLKKACVSDLYSVKHPEFAVLHDPTNAIYDIDGHCVWTISGTVHIDIDGVVFDQLDLDNWLGLAKSNKASRFHVRLPSKPK